MSALTLVLGLYVAGAAPPCGVDVVVSVDHSASIPRALGSVRVLQQSLERMASGMKPQDRLGLAFYSAEAKLYMPLAVRDRVLTEIGPALRRAGRFGVQSDMERGLDNAIGHQEAESRPRAVRVIVLLTDGDLRVAGGAEAKARARVRIMREMVARMRAGGIRLEVVTVGRNEPALLSATGITGGQVMRASGPELGDRLIAAYDRGRKTCGEIVKPRRDAHTRLRRKGRAPPEPTPGAAPTEETEVEEAEPEEDAPRRRRKKASNLWWIILIIAAVVLLILALVLWLLLSGKKEVPAPLPPPPSEIEREALSYRTESLKEPCAWHLERQGVGPCYVCNRMVCAECGVPHGPRYLCPEHVSHAQIARPKKRRRRPAPPGEGVPRRSRRAKAPPPGDSRVPEEVLAHALEAHDYAPAPGRKPAPPPPAREGDRHVKLRALPLSLLNEMQDMLGDWAPYDLPPGGEEDELEAALRSWDRLPPRIREEHYGGDMKRFLRDYMRVRYGCASPWGSGAQQASQIMPIVAKGFSSCFDR